MAKRGALVCQILERVSGEIFERYPEIIRSYARHRHGVYALYRGDKLYYVGLATDLRRRLKAHLRDRHRHAWTKFSLYLTLDEDHMKELETLFLRIYRPPGNKQKGKFKNCENLLTKFKRDYKVAKDDEYRDLVGMERKKRRSGSLRMQAGRRGVTLAPFLNGESIRLKATWRGEKLSARVLRSGLIKFSGKRYRTPSGAGKAARRGGAVDGWYFWRYERAPGDWVALDKLRRQ